MGTKRKHATTMKNAWAIARHHSLFDNEITNAITKPTDATKNNNMMTSPNTAPSISGKV